MSYLVVFPQKTTLDDFVLEKPKIDEKFYFSKPNPKINKDSLMKEIAFLLDSIREVMYKKDFLKTEVDKLASKGCEHHNNYLKNVKNPKEPNTIYLTHGEPKINSKGGEYIGKEELIDNAQLRHYTFALTRPLGIEYFTRNLLRNNIYTFEYVEIMDKIKKDSIGYMEYLGEVCSAGSLSCISKYGYSIKDVAKLIVYGFYESKPHWCLLRMDLYTNIAGDIQIEKIPSGEYRYWFTMTIGRKIIMKRTLVKNDKLTDFQRGLGFKEFYYHYDETIIENKIPLSIINTEVTAKKKKRKWNFFWRK
jgi:hypothetical protein